MNKIGLVALASLLAVGVGVPSAQAADRRLMLLMGPTQDRLLNGFAQSFTAAAKAKGMAVTLLTSPYDPALC